MKIGIDARFYNESGVGRYLQNLIANLKVLDQKNEYLIFLLKKDYEKFANTANFQAIRADFGWYGFTEQFRLPKIINKFKLDLAHFPHFNVPIFFSGKFVVTIHDLIHQHFQMKRATRLNPLMYLFKHFGYRKVFKNAISDAEKILVPSNFVKELLINKWKIFDDKIIVTPEAVDDKIISIGNKMKKAKIDQIMNKFNIKSPYVFYVGNAHPHKNVEGLIKAFLILRRNYQYLQLVLSGQDHYFWHRIERDYQYKDIIFTNRVSDEELVALYKNAQAFVLPSYEEGFGLPILEAMACGTPVVASNTGSLIEVGGDAALYFDPSNIEEMQKKINLVLRSEKLKKELIEKGNQRAKLFSWKRLAEQTKEVYSQCV